VGIVFCTPFLDSGAREAEVRMRETAAYQALSAVNDTGLYLAQSEYLQRSLPPLPLQRVVDHVLHAVEVAGIDHVGIGSDYDGIQRTPQGLEDASCYGNLAEALLGAGLGEEDVRKVMGGNMSRVYSQVTGPGTRASEARLLPMG